MAPFCRTVEEGREVIAEMAKHGLRRGERSLEARMDRPCESAWAWNRGL